MFVYNIKKTHDIDGIKLQINGNKNNISHTFVTTLKYKELEKNNYHHILDSLVKGLEKKIDLLIMDNIY